MTPVSTTPEELFMLIGEREFIRYKQEQQIKDLLIQVDEMSKAITELRKENGKLEQSTHNDAV